uniref:Lectin/glucanase superfamily protein n=1 Tax=viral metagenome TaxID=1070528 RepID=A0A6C0LRB3_9ZZZZ
MNYTIIVLGIIIVFLVYYLYINYISASKTILKSVDLNSANPDITLVDKAENVSYGYGAWVYINSWDQNKSKGIFSRSNNISLYLDTNRPILKCDISLNSVNAGTPTTNQSIIITENFPLQKWVYIIVSVDAGSGNGTIVDCYINGKLVKSSKITSDAKQPGSATVSPIKIGAGTIWDAVLAKFTRFTKPVDPQTAWDNYLSGNGSTGLFSIGNFSANLAVLKDNIQYSNVKLF